MNKNDYNDLKQWFLEISSDISAVIMTILLVINLFFNRNWKSLYIKIINRDSFCDSKIFWFCMLLITTVTKYVFLAF